MAIICEMANWLLKLTENAVILGYNFSLSDFNFFLIFLGGREAQANMEETDGERLP